MGTGLIIVIALLIGVIVYVISVYNGLQTLKTRIVASIQEIGNQLKRQSSLIPNLQESAKAFLKQEKTLYDMITKARKAVDEAQTQGGDKIDQAIDQINAILPKLNILVESNPEIKSDAVITKLMDELRDTSDKIMYARRTLIDLSAEYNRKLVTFPSNLVASTFGFKPEKGLDTAMTGEHVSVSAKETEDVQVKLD
jgi:LemA protein